MALTELLLSGNFAHVLLISIFLGVVSLAVHRLLFHPLSQIPGPTISKLTSLWTHYHIYIGDEASQIARLHKIYGPVVRIAPNAVCIADGACLAPIYSDKGGFPKADCYRNFDIDGFSSLFSELSKDKRAPKAKSVLPLFSTANLRQGEVILKGAIEGFISRLKRERDNATLTNGSVNILTLSRSLALDAVTGYLFGKSYGASDEDMAEKTEQKSNRHLSASGFVDGFVGVGRFFYLPNWVFLAVELASEKFLGTKETGDSMTKVDQFVKDVVSRAKADDGSYPGRMLKAGLSSNEVVAQCKDLMFAGTDSSGMNLSIFCWQIAQQPEIYATLEAEVKEAYTANPTDFDPSTLPYLRACIRETLRLSMANPTRLPRVVPPSGWSFHSEVSAKTYFFPPGTMVSVQMHTLHHNPEVYKDPFSFRPSRWIEAEAALNPAFLRTMLRDYIPFGLGSRQCIARNLAMTELNLAAAAVMMDGTLDRANAVTDRVEIIEWFNSRVKGEEILLRWTDDR